MWLWSLPESRSSFVAASLDSRRSSCSSSTQCERDEYSCMMLGAVARVRIPRSIVCVSERDE